MPAVDTGRAIIAAPIVVLLIRRTEPKSLFVFMVTKGYPCIKSHGELFRSICHDFLTTFSNINVRHF